MRLTGQGSGQGLGLGGTGRKNDFSPLGKKVFVSSRTVILPDGTYGTEDVYADAASGESSEAPLRTLISGGDFLLSASLGVALTKLVCQHFTEDNKINEDPELKKSVVKASYIVSSLLQHAKHHPSGGEKCDGAIRLNQCVRCLHGLLIGDKRQVEIWSKTAVASLARLGDVLEASRQDIWGESPPGKIATNKGIQREILPWQPIGFRQLEGTALESLGDEPQDLAWTQDFLGLPTLADSGTSEEDEERLLFQQRLLNSKPMTGLADPIYVEAFVRVNAFTVFFELWLINRTKDTLQDVRIELCAHGQLKVADRPPCVNLGPWEVVKVTASIKVESTESGVVFGYLTFEKSGAGAEKTWIVLNELQLGLSDFMKEGCKISGVQFRTMWSEFEWENKINVNTTFKDPVAFIRHLIRHTRMRVVGARTLTYDGDEPSLRPFDPSAIAAPDVDEMPTVQQLLHTRYFCVNLYSCSIFGGEVLANFSVHQAKEGKLQGSVRLRSRTQGLALSMGDRVSLVQRGDFGL